ncbi:hypothetical protein AQJ27_24815 [Streptomyces olivochromogenes]|nr:hypothetical protein AQJ27_24815 [Streptomyces olivochromogenes]
MVLSQMLTTVCFDHMSLPGASRSTRSRASGDSTANAQPLPVSPSIAQSGRSHAPGESFSVSWAVSGSMVVPGCAPRRTASSS